MVESEENKNNEDPEDLFIQDMHMTKLMRQVIATDIEIEGVKVDLIDKLEHEQVRYKELKERCEELEKTL